MPVGKTHAARALALALTLLGSEAWVLRGPALRTPVARWHGGRAATSSRSAAPDQGTHEAATGSLQPQPSRRGFLEGTSAAVALVGLVDPALAADAAPVVNGATDGKTFSAAWSAVRLR